MQKAGAVLILVCNKVGSRNHDDGRRAIGPIVAEVLYNARTNTEISRYLLTTRRIGSTPHFSQAYTDPCAEAQH